MKAATSDLYLLLTEEEIFSTLATQLQVSTQFIQRIRNHAENPYHMILDILQRWRADFWETVSIFRHYKKPSRLANSYI